MKFNIKSAILGCVIGVMVSSGVSVFAYNGTKNISATFKNIKIYVDGSELTPRDSNGNVLEPFIYNGSTYLPIRAVGEAVGKNVSYDANTNSVYLGSSNSQISTNDGVYISPYSKECVDEDTFMMGGVKYRNSIGFWNAYDGIAYYNLGGKYNTLSFIYGVSDDSESDFTGDITFYGDGKIIKELNLKAGELPKNMSLNVSGVSQLTIKHENGRYVGGHSVIANIELKK